MSRDPALDDSAAAVLAEQIGCAEALMVTLERERQALLDEDLEALAAACAAKLDQARQLQRLDQRLRALRPAARPGLPDPDPALAVPWQRLRELAACCEQANRANGQQVEARERQLRIALDALRPRSAAVYSRRGRSVSPYAGPAGGSRLHDRA